MVNAAIIINFIAATLVLGLGYFVLRRDARAVIGRLFAITSLSISLWIFTAATADAIRDFDIAFTLVRLAIFGPTLSLALIYLFILHFPRARKPIRPGTIVAVLMPSLLIIPFIFTPYNVVKISFEEWGTDWTPGLLYSVLAAYLLIICIFTGVELFRKRQSAASSDERAQITFMFLAFFSMIGLGALANLALPLLGYTKASAFGPASPLLFVIFTTYAIVRHHLLDVKVVAAELFGSLLALVTFLQILNATSAQDYMIRLLLFLLTLGLVIMFIRSVLQEVRRREEIQHLAAQLAASNKRLRQLDELKSTMVSIASHQIRGPLGGLRGYLTMFRDGDLGPLTERQKNIIKMNINVLTRLLNAVETFLDITRLEAGKMLLKKEILPLDEAVRDVVEEFRVMAEKKGLKLAFEIEGPRPVWVEFDPEKIKHVIFNLIDNAMKYTERGSVTVRVKVADKEAVFEVSDTGVGVPPEDLHRLFGKFERGELVVDRGGSGLGLYVVKMLTELQGGRVWVSSPGVGKGATFAVALPLSKHF